MIRYVIVSLINGIVFGVIDGLINVNPFAQKIYQIYKPIAKTSINAPAGIVIDILYGFIMGFIFLILYSALPGSNGLIKGIVFALIIWFFRVFMSAVSSWMMFNVPITTLLYTAATGLVEMLIIGIIFGAFLKPFSM
ncbi:MAG: hypothetical protein JW881_20565 [Spirochaetales bacterium]|nr:hypothetical protein [Spirochaetales bacterium]